MSSRDGVHLVVEEFTVEMTVAFVLYQIALEERGPIVKLCEVFVRRMTVQEEMELVIGGCTTSSSCVP